VEKIFLPCKYSTLCCKNGQNYKSHFFKIFLAIFWKVFVLFFQNFQTKNVVQTRLHIRSSGDVALMMARLEIYIIINDDFFEHEYSIE